MVDVFISYSRVDQAQVARLAQAIEGEGYSVWWDKELPPHLNYGDVITEKIAQAKAAVVVWSHTAAKSEWVRAEADMARNQRKLVQTALDDVMPPLPFNQIQFAEIGDWRGEPDHSGWRKVKASLADLCGAQAAGEGQPAASFARQQPAQTPEPAPVTASVSSSRAPLWVGAALAVVLAAGAGVWFTKGGADEPEIGREGGPPAPEDDADEFDLGATVSDPDGYTNVRASGSTDARIVGRIEAGERFRTFRQSGTWWQVRIDDGTIGYVARSRIVLDGEPMPSTGPTPDRQVALPPAETAPVPNMAETATEPGRFDMTFPDSGTRRLTEADVADLGPATLRIARNEIYARKGRRFANRELASYFAQFSWYRPVADEVRLNDIERANVALLTRAERRYGQ